MRGDFGCYVGIDADDTNPKLRMIRWKSLVDTKLDVRREDGEGEKGRSTLLSGSIIHGFCCTVLRDLRECSDLSLVDT